MLEIKSLTFSYPESNSVFKEFSFVLQRDEICSLIGKSGCGKSTLLKMIYGVLDWQEGKIYFNKRQLLGPKGNLVPGEKDIKWVAQEFDLMPYTTIAENVGVYFSNINLTEKKTKVLELLKVVGLEELANKKVQFLSGGQKQRVAIAKALAESPSLLLLDEPFSQIDAYLKNKLQRSLFQFVKENGISVLMVTHNIQDALAFSDRIDVLGNEGILESNTPKQIYFQPKHKETAQLLGDMNILQGAEFDLDDRLYFVHPFQLEISENGFQAKVLNTYFKGAFYWIEVSFSNQILLIQHHTILSIGEEIHFSFK